MQPKIHPSRNRSGVSIAAPAVEIENVQMVLDLTKPISARASAKLASVRIRDAHQVLADLLLEDDLEHENGLLLSTVAVDLSDILLELERLSGLQRFYEFWVQDVKVQDEDEGDDDGG